MELIHRAAWDGDVAAIDRLVAKDGERLNARALIDWDIAGTDPRGCTLLMLAAYQGRDAVVARLLGLGADVGLRSVYGRFAARWASYGKQSSSLALLLDAGASMTATDNEGLTLLMAAAEYGATDCITLLLERLGDGVGEQLAVVDNEGNSAAHMACGSDRPSTLALLLDAGASMTARDNDGLTPLLAAAEEGATDCIKLLLERSGAQVGEQLAMADNEGNSAAHLACDGNQPSTLALLLDASASMTARNSLGQTPLMAAAEEGATGCVALLLERFKAQVGEQLGMADNEGNSAAHTACSFDHPSSLALLLDAGADPTIHNHVGQTPLATAQVQGHQDCVALLEAALAEPQRLRALFKARALLAARIDIPKARHDALQHGLPFELEVRAGLVAAPVYIKERVAWAQELPDVQVEGAGPDDKLADCLKYALGLEGGGGVVFLGQEPTVGMLPEVFVELLEMMVPKWDPAQKGRLLGEGVEGGV